MPIYSYIAKDFNLNKKQGTVISDNEKEARQKLREDGLFVLKIKEVKEKKQSESVFQKSLFSSSEPKVPLNEVTLFSRQFATLIESGVPITKSLFILGNNTKNKVFKKMLNTIREEIENGSSLSVSLGKYSKTFPQIYINMVEAGELSGALPEILNRLAIYMENDKTMRSKVKSAFIYPISVLVVSVLVIIVMLIFVIPNFIPIFADLGEDLPLPTKALLGLSDLVVGYWWALLIGTIGIIGGFMILNKFFWFRKFNDRIKLKLPVIGMVFSKSAIARFCRTLETLQKSGVPLMQSMEIVARTSGNIIVQEAIESAISSLEKGEGISEPLEQTKVFPILVTQMINIGEETGELEKLLSKIADFYEEDVDIAIKTMTSLMEPIMTVFLGVGVAFVAAAVLMPMYGMMGSLQDSI